MIFPKITCFVVVMSILSIFCLGYGIYHAITWLVTLTFFICVIDGCLGLLCSLGPALSGVFKHPTKTEDREFVILLCLGFGNALAMLVIIGWSLYTNS